MNAQEERNKPMFKVNDKVEITKPHKLKIEEYLGRVGIVSKVLSSTEWIAYFVRFPEEPNNDVPFFGNGNLKEAK
jgi:hypothetical protein